MTFHYTKCPIGEEHRRMQKAYAGDIAAAGLSDLNLYHWSPRSRQKQILRYGLMPGKPSLQGEWKPPYVCFADDVRLAWLLSGALHPEIPEWDLWQVYSVDAGRWEAIFDTYVNTGRHFVKEYRVYHRIYKRHVHYLASRTSHLPSDHPRDMMLSNARGTDR